MTATLDLQIACEHTALPSEQEIQSWLDLVLNSQTIDSAEITVRVVDAQESQQLNHTYRQKNKPTNVLSFPFEAPPGFGTDLLGDLVICAQVVQQEAETQGKLENHHWAHMILHGTLHLLGFDHQTDEQANQMEQLEVSLLQQLGIDDPYKDH